MARKLLLIENEKAFQTEAIKALNKLGYEVIIASSYEEAVKLLEIQAFEGIISNLFIPESEEENGIGKSLIENLKDVISDPEIRESFKNTYAPLGLHILGIAFAKDIPMMIISPSGLHDRNLSFVRYAVIGKTGIFIEKLMEMNVDKSSESGWTELLLNKRLKDHTPDILYVDLESRKEIFGI